MKSGWLILCLATLLALPALPGCSESRGSIEGTVYLEDGAPGSGLVVRAVRPEYPGILLRTDVDGIYRIENIPTGRWDIEFYDSNDWQVGLETVNVQTSETVTLDFTVGEKPLPEGVIPSKLENAP